MYFSEQGNVDDDATLIAIFLFSSNLQSCCLMQSANVIHREGTLRLQTVVEKGNHPGKFLL